MVKKTGNFNIWEVEFQHLESIIEFYDCRNLIMKAQNLSIEGIALNNSLEYFNFLCRMIFQPLFHVSICLEYLWPS